ncbi:MAG TPA: alpha/beta fold hydrolase [Gemmatimonadaceae bacterium]|nr:alpha/beta fold hydrolase [Gemmatimonadaceae bacterium]
MPPIPAPRSEGFTRGTPFPLYWAGYGTEGAPPLLVLHGGPGASHDYLLPQLLRLDTVANGGRDLLFYDQRGGGRSRHDEDRAPIGWQEQAADVGRVIEEFGLESPRIVGYSWGGLLALLYALEATEGRLGPVPEQIILIDPAPLSRHYRDSFEAEFARRQKSPAVEQLRAELAESGLRERDPDAYRQRVFELSVAGYFADPARARDLTPFRVVGRVQQGVWSSLGDFDLVPRLSRLRIPSVVVHGRQDPIPLESSEAGAQALGAELFVIEDCGHVPYVEQPDQLFRVLAPFV